VFYKLVLYAEYDKATKNEVRQTFLGDIDQKYKFTQNFRIFAGPL